MSVDLVQRSLWVLSFLLSVILAVRLFVLKLAPTYRFFLTFLLFYTARTLLALPFDINSPTYENIWKVTEPVTWVLSVLVVLELCSLAFKEYRGIQALGRWMIYGSLVLSLVFSIIILVPTWRSSKEPPFSVQRFLMVERGIDFCLVLLLLTVLASLVIFPVRLSKNMAIHSVLYSIYFMSLSAGIFVANVGGKHLFWIMSSSLMGVMSVCLIAWVALLTRQGEEIIMVMRGPLPVAEDQLVEHLASINATLMRASEKAHPGWPFTKPTI